MNSGPVDSPGLCIRRFINYRILGGKFDNTGRQKENSLFSPQAGECGHRARRPQRRQETAPIHGVLPRVHSMLLRQPVGPLFQDEPVPMVTQTP